MIDTSTLNIHELRARMRDMFGDERAAAIRVTVVSFGYKYGLPVDADMVVDCRFLPNPHWIPELAPLSGLDEPVREYVLGQQGASEFLRAYLEAFQITLSGYERGGKHFVTVAVGCTRRQSTAASRSAEEIAARLAANWPEVQGQPSRSRT